MNNDSLHWVFLYFIIWGMTIPTAFMYLVVAKKLKWWPHKVLTSLPDALLMSVAWWCILLLLFLEYAGSFLGSGFISLWKRAETAWERL